MIHEHFTQFSSIALNHCNTTRFSHCIRDSWIVTLVLHLPLRSASSHHQNHHIVL